MAAVVGNVTMNHTAQAIYEHDSYHASIRERKPTDDLVNGNISYQDFKVALEKLYSVEEVIEYSKTANDKLLSSKVESYLQTKDMEQTMVNKAIPTFATPAIVGGAVAAIAGRKRKKYNEELEKVQEEMHEM